MQKTQARLFVERLWANEGGALERCAEYDHGMITRANNLRALLECSIEPINPEGKFVLNLPHYEIDEESFRANHTYADEVLEWTWDDILWLVDAFSKERTSPLEESLTYLTARQDVFDCVYGLIRRVASESPDYVDMLRPWYAITRDPPLPLSSKRDGTYNGVLQLAMPWRVRETLRLRWGVYTAANDAKVPSCPQHHLHRSMTKDGMIAYTPNPGDGRRNRQVATRVGKYLNRTFPGTTQETIEIAVSALCGNEIRFATTTKEIVAIYEASNKDESCMGGTDFNTHLHPAAVYGDSDLSVAYLGDINDEIEARAVVWQKEKTFSKVYGYNANRLASMLTDAGYTKKSPFGARIRRIPNEYRGEFHENTVLMPYLDPGGLGVCTLDNDWFVITSDSVEFYASMTVGHYPVTELRYCEGCSEDLPERAWNRNDGCHHGWCDECIENSTWVCDHCGERINEDDSSTYVITTRRDGEDWCSDCRDNDTVYVEHQGEYYEYDHPDIREVQGEYVTLAYFNERCVIPIEFRVTVSEDGTKKVDVVALDADYTENYAGESLCA